MNVKNKFEENNKTTTNSNQKYKLKRWREKVIHIYTHTLAIFLIVVKEKKDEITVDKRKNLLEEEKEFFFAYEKISITSTSHAYTTCWIDCTVYCTDMLLHKAIGFIYRIQRGKKEK